MFIYSPDYDFPDMLSEESYNPPDILRRGDPVTGTSARKWGGCPRWHWCQRTDALVWRGIKALSCRTGANAGPIWWGKNLRPESEPLTPARRCAVS